jgi:autotransporter passenger strand-loop-strand repeat protein
MRKLRTAIAAAILAALTLTATQSTVANGPPQPVPPPPPFLFPAGIACPDFDLQLSSSGGNVHTKQFVDRNGETVKTITAGKGFLLTYTNLDAGNSVTIRTDGSVTKTTYNPDGTQTVSATGHNGLIMFPADIPAGPTTTQYIGRIVYTIDPNGVFTLLRTSGSQRDICAELAN